MPTPSNASPPRMAEPRIPGFAESHAGVKGRRVLVRTGGNGPTVLLLHGFPETGLMWHEIAPRLAAQFSVVGAASEVNVRFERSGDRKLPDCNRPNRERSTPPE